MNLRRKTPSDSLYLLLDTLCNAFGGIILLAVMVVLLTSKEKSQSATSSDTGEMFQRRLTLAQTNLEQLLQLAASLRTKANDDNWKQQVLLLSTRKELQDKLQQTRVAVARNSKEIDTASAGDPSERLKFLNAELAAAQARKLDVQNSFGAANENIKRLRQRLADMERQATAKINELQRPLRLPKERNTDKDVFNIIVQYGRVYPLRNANLERNTATIGWQDTGSSAIPTPKVDKGLEPRRDGAALLQLFRTLPSGEYYVAFYVFEDSFAAFNAVKQMSVTAGINYGWMPLGSREAPLKFGSAGTRPKVQ